LQILSLLLELGIVDLGKKPKKPSSSHGLTTMMIPDTNDA
jgi:hypothetical protein